MEITENSQHSHLLFTHVRVLSRLSRKVELLFPLKEPAPLLSSSGQSGCEAICINPYEKLSSQKPQQHPDREGSHLAKLQLCTAGL